MRIFEMTPDEATTGYYDPAEDTMTKAHKDDVVKPRLTLKDLNRLKKMRELKRLEGLKRQDILSTMYAPAEEPTGGMGF